MAAHGHERFSVPAATPSNLLHSSTVPHSFRALDRLAIPLLIALLAPGPAPAAERFAVPWSTIGFPIPGDRLPAGAPVDLRGEAGGLTLPRRVELSFDGGATWLPAAGTDPWSLHWTPAATEPARILA